MARPHGSKQGTMAHGTITAYNHGRCRCDECRVAKNIYTAARRAWFDEQKRRPCVDCGGTFPSECMDFDHVPERGPKLFGIAAAIFRSRVALLAEMAKCDLVCANCHRIRTRKRGYRN